MGVPAPISACWITFFGLYCPRFFVAWIPRSIPTMSLLQDKERQVIGATKEMIAVGRCR